jgi:hypothetical protein
MFIPELDRALLEDGDPRPWLLYGMNIYTMELEHLLQDWPGHAVPRPLFISEFGAEPDTPEGRAAGYAGMWRTMRAYAGYVLGGAPYVWTTAGPEPVDAKWGLMDINSTPVDDTFAQLAQEWRAEPGNAGRTCKP